jgi:hypothetical protein
MHPDVILKATTNLTICDPNHNSAVDRSAQSAKRGGAVQGSCSSWSGRHWLVYVYCPWSGLLSGKKIGCASIKFARLDTASGSRLIPSLQNSRLEEMKP